MGKEKEFENQLMFINEQLKEDILNLSFLQQEFFESTTIPDKTNFHFQYYEMQNKFRQLYKSMLYNSKHIDELLKI